MRIAATVQVDDHTASVATGRFVGRRVGQLLEVVFVGSIPHENLRLEVGSAFRAVLPFSRVPLAVMVGAEGVSAVIAMATVPGVGEKHVILLVITNPLTATLGAREVVLLAAQPATRGILFRTPDGSPPAGCFRFIGFFHKSPSRARVMGWACGTAKASIIATAGSRGDEALIAFLPEDPCRPERRLAAGFGRDGDVKPVTNRRSHLTRLGECWSLFTSAATLRDLRPRELVEDG